MEFPGLTDLDKAHHTRHQEALDSALYTKMLKDFELKHFEISCICYGNGNTATEISGIKCYSELA